MIDIEITGTEELKRKLEGLTNGVANEILRGALYENALDIKDEMVGACHVSENGVHFEKIKTRNHEAGTLARSIRVLVDKVRGNYPTIWVKPVKGQGDPDGWYAKFLEYGTRFHAPHPFIRPTYDRMQSQVREGIDAIVREDIKKYMES